MIRKTQQQQQTYVLFIGCLPPQTNENNLVKYFAKFGSITGIDLGRDKKLGFCLGFAKLKIKLDSPLCSFVSAGHSFKTFNITIKECEDNAHYEDLIAKMFNERVFISNLPKKWSDMEIKELFGQFGEVRSVLRVLSQQKKPQPFGYVHFYEIKSAKKCIKQKFVYVDIKRKKIICQKYTYKRNHKKKSLNERKELKEVINHQKVHTRNSTNDSSPEDSLNRNNDNNNTAKVEEDYIGSLLSRRQNNDNNSKHSKSQTNYFSGAGPPQREEGGGNGRTNSNGGQQKKEADSASQNKEDDNQRNNKHQHLFQGSGAEKNSFPNFNRNSDYLLRRNRHKESCDQPDSINVSINRQRILMGTTFQNRSKKLEKMIQFHSCKPTLKEYIGLSRRREKWLKKSHLKSGNYRLN